MPDFTRIPIIDASPMWSADSTGLERMAGEILAAYGEVGFGYLVNHGVHRDLVEGVFDASARFHAQPLEAKMRVELSRLHRGFIPIDTSTDRNSTLAEVTKPNQSESFMVMREDEVGRAYLDGPNQWPEDLPGFREAVAGYNDALSALARRLIRVIAMALETDPDEFARAFEPPTTWLRLLHYPPQPPMEGLYGSAPHTDFGCITILAQDDVGGLQVMNRAGDWIDAPCIPDAFVMNVGDMLHRWSNGRLLSTPHRVINRSGRERYSCPFFFDPNVAVEIAPLVSCVTVERPAAFEPVVFGDFLRTELRAGYHKHAEDATG